MGESNVASRMDQLIGGLQTALHLDFLSREGFYVVAGIAAILVLYLFAKLYSAARDADELSRQRRKLKARKQAEIEWEAAEARRRKRRGIAKGGSAEEEKQIPVNSD